MTTTREAALEAALNGCIAAIEHADMADGVCCCGDNMDNHSEPMNCGHSPVDAGEYHAHQALTAARAALSTPATEPQGLVENDTIDSFCLTLRRLVSDAYAERDRFGHIAATIHVNALHHGATNAEVEAMLSGEISFVNWIADKVEARPAPQPAADTRVVGYELSMNDEGGIYLKDRPDAGLVAIAVRDPEMPWRRNHPEAVDAIIARSAIIGNATPAQPDKIAEAARGGVRKAVASAIFDPGATEGYRGERTVTEWQTDAVMRALAGKGE